MTKIGFSILSHKQPDTVFVELLKQLDRYQDREIAIHHDFSKAAFNKSLLGEISFDLVDPSIETQWSHVNNIEAILRTFEILYTKKCDWFITLSANCYPVKTPVYIQHFLEQSKVDGYIECNNIHTDFFDFYTYFRKAFQTSYLFSIPFIRRNGKLYWKTIRKNRNPSEIIFNNTFIPYHGSDWFMINRKSMKYILDNKEKITDIIHFLKDVNKGHDLNVCPPEVVFQTLLANNKELILNNNNYRYIDWTNAVNWHPNTLTVKDFVAIVKTDALFTRKVDAAASMELIQLINKNILSC